MNFSQLGQFSDLRDLVLKLKRKGVARDVVQCEGKHVLGAALGLALPGTARKSASHVTRGPGL